MKFLLIDDHKIIREGLRQILLMHFPSATCDEGASAEDVMKHISASDYDLVICDLSMPGRSGLDVLKQVKETKPNLRVLILSMHPDEHYAVRAIKSGAWGYINKSDGAEVLIPAVQRILQGRKFIPTDLAERLADNLTTDDKTEDRLHRICPAGNLIYSNCWLKENQFQTYRNSCRWACQR